MDSNYLKAISLTGLSLSLSYTQIEAILRLSVILLSIIYTIIKLLKELKK